MLTLNQVYAKLKAFLGKEITIQQCLILPKLDATVALNYICCVL
jgi:hypothetical protein